MKKDNSAYKALAAKYNKQGKKKTALELYDKAIKADPWDPMPYMKAGVISGLMDDLIKSSEYLHKFLELPDSYNYPDLREKAEAMLETYPIVKKPENMMDEFLLSLDKQRKELEEHERIEREREEAERQARESAEDSVDEGDSGGKGGESGEKEGGEKQGKEAGKSDEDEKAGDGKKEGEKKGG